MGYNQRIQKLWSETSALYTLPISAKQALLDFLGLKGPIHSWILFTFSWVRFWKFMYTTWVYMFFPSISRVAIVSKSFEGKTDRTEEWYGTQYKQEAIPDEVIKVWLMHVWIGLVCEGHRGTWAPQITQLTAQVVESDGPVLSITILRGISTEMEGCILGFACRNCTVAPSWVKDHWSPKFTEKQTYQDRQSEIGTQAGAASGLHPVLTWGGAVL